MEVLLAIWVALFVSPLILGAYVVTQDADVRTLRLFFSLATGLFVVVLICGAAGAIIANF